MPPLAWHLRRSVTLAIQSTISIDFCLQFFRVAIAVTLTPIRILMSPHSALSAIVNATDCIRSEGISNTALALQDPSTVCFLWLFDRTC
eukprot:COSAG05_NODE_410_length_10109_cov_29.470430_5_plen_89_part_00